MAYVLGLGLFVRPFLIATNFQRQVGGAAHSKSGHLLDLDLHILDGHIGGFGTSAELSCGDSKITGS